MNTVKNWKNSKKNNWFKKAIKVAVAIGEDANCKILAEFTDTPEGVLTVHNPEALKKMIRFVSVTSSQIGSKSTSVGKSGIDEVRSKQDEFIEQVNIAYSNGDFDDEYIEW